MGASQSTSALETCLVSSIPSSLVATPATSLFYNVEDVHQYNLNIPVQPIAVTYPQTVEHVSSIVKCAAANKVNVQARGGGHGYANYGMFL
jgi:FAD/FMN-containing dehydrogenase